jgi:hypothetical protein
MGSFFWNLLHDLLYNGENYIRLWHSGEPGTLVKKARLRKRLGFSNVRWGQTRIIDYSIMAYADWGCNNYPYKTIYPLFRTIIYPAIWVVPIQ